MKTRALLLKIPLLAAILIPPQCRAEASYSPTVDVLGSYFPAWMVCIVSGIVLVLVVRLLLIGLGMHTHMRPKSIVYPCMTVLFTLAVWLAFFKN
jgi:hypothetical protein